MTCMKITESQNGQIYPEDTFSHGAAHSIFNSDTRNFISHITYYSLMFFIVYAFKGQVHVFAGRVKIVSHSSCRTSAISKYFCPLR